MSILRFTPASLIALAYSLLSLAPAQQTSEQPYPMGESATASVRHWLNKTEKPLAEISSQDVRDLKPLVKVIGRAQVIGFGETAHQTRELQLLRLRALQALANTGRVRVLAMEAGYVETIELNRWITGETNAHPDFHAAFPFNGEGRLPELRAAMEWLHSFNQTLALQQRIQFYGLDLPYGGGKLRPALDYVWNYLDQVDPEFGRHSRDSMSGALSRLGEGWPAGAKKRFDALDEPDRSALIRGVGELEKQFESERAHYSSTEKSRQFERIRQAVTIARQTLTFMQDPQDGSNPRDQALATNLQWILKRTTGNETVIIWAHNAHVQKQPIEVVGAPMKPATSMGQILARELGGQYLAIGTTVDRLAIDASSGPTSAKPDSVDQVLASPGVSSYLLDLRHSPRRGVVARWLEASHDMRFQETYIRVVPRQAFDAVFFVSSVSPSVAVESKP